MSDNPKFLTEFDEIPNTLMVGDEINSETARLTGLVKTLRAKLAWQNRRLAYMGLACGAVGSACGIVATIAAMMFFDR